MNKKAEIVAEIEKIKLKDKIQMQDVQTLALCYGAIQALEYGTSNIQLEHSESADLFPSWKDYQLYHTEHNFKKLCLEIQEFCQSIYVMTTTDERKIYNDMINNLKTI